MYPRCYDRRSLSRRLWGALYARTDAYQIRRARLALPNGDIRFLRRRLASQQEKQQQLPTQHQQRLQSVGGMQTRGML